MGPESSVYTAMEKRYLAVIHSALQCRHVVGNGSTRAVKVLCFVD